MRGGGLEYGRDVLAETQGVEGFADVVARDGLLGLLLGDVVGLGRDKGDKLDTTLDQQIAGLLRKRDASRRRQDLADDLLDGGCKPGLAFESRMLLSAPPKRLLRLGG